MDETFLALLDPDVLTARYEATYNNAEFPLTQQWWNGGPITNERADEYSFLFYNAVTEPAPMNVAGGTARVMSAGGATPKYAKCHVQYDQMPINVDAMACVRHPDDRSLQAKGAESIRRCFDEFGTRHLITKELILAKSLSAGIIYIGVDGKILEDSTGAVMTIDLNVPANNKTTLNGIVAALWSVKTALIADQLDALVRRAGQNNTERPTDIWINQINKKWLRKNDQFVEWAAYNNMATDVVLRGEMIQNLWGFNWHFVSGTYKASDGSTKDFIPTDKAIITPPPNGRWVKRTNHLTLVPRETGLVPTVEAGLAATEEKFGPFSFAQLQGPPNTVSLNMYMGDRFGFVFADPSAINIATAFPVTS